MNAFGARCYLIHVAFFGSGEASSGLVARYSSIESASVFTYELLSFVT